MGTNDSPQQRDDAVNRFLRDFLRGKDAMICCRCLEHGHNNNRSDDYSSTAYWYQTEPHKDHPIILPVAQRLPLPDILNFKAEDLKKCFDY